MPITYNISIEPTIIENHFRITWKNANNSTVCSFEQKIDFALEDVQWLWQWPQHRKIVGEKLFGLMDGESHMFQQAQEYAFQMGDSLLLNLQTDTSIDDWPFELVASQGLFLLPQQLHIVRRIADGSPGKTILPKNRPLKLLFMACSAKDVRPVLDFEKEEEAIFQITDDLTIDIEIEDSGSLEGLGGKLAQEEYDVVHLSGHAGIDKSGKPYFVTENDTGARDRVSPDQLWRIALKKNKPRLVILSGSRTGETPGKQEMRSLTAESSFSRLLVEKYSIPAVLGWGRNVSDEQAIHSGKVLLKELSRGQSILSALQRARHELAETFPNTDKPAGPLMRLYASNVPLSAIVMKEQRQRPQPRNITHIYLKNSQVKILKDGFIGRRRQLQQSVRGLKDDSGKVGLLILGMGGLGKSCLAGKICERFGDYTLVIIKGRFNTINMETALKNAFILNQDENGKRILSLKVKMEDKLIHLCSTSFKEKKYLFLLDDFEKNLEDFENGEYGKLLPEAAALLKVLLYYLPPGCNGSRMVITCRYEFPLLFQENNIIEKRLEKIWLTGFNKTEQRKKFRELKNIFTLKDRETARQLLASGHGNPRLMEWIDLLSMQLKGKELETYAVEIANKQEEFINEHVIRGLLTKGGSPLKQLLSWISIYRIPVMKEGVSLVAKKAGIKGWEKLLQKGMALSLVEHNQVRESYQVTPHLREELLTKLHRHHLCHEAAFDYFKRVCEATELVEAVLIEEWVFHALGCKREDVAFQHGRSLVRQLREHLSLRESLRIGEWLLAEKENCFSTEQDGLFLNDLAMTMHEIGNPGKAVELLKQTLTIMKKNCGENHTLVATSLNNLGEAWKALEEHGEAIKCYRQALNIWQKIHGKEHDNVAVVMNNLGLIYGSLSEHRDAVDYFQKAVNIWKKIHGEKHPQVAIALNNLGGVLNEIGETSNAIDHYKQALAIDEAISGREHPDVALELNNIATAYYKMGALQKAIDYSLQSIVVYVKIFGREHPTVARGLNNLGEIIRTLGEPRKAINLFLQAFEIWKKIYGEIHHQVATAKNNLGSAWQDLGEHEKATEYYQQALSIYEALYGREHPDVAIELNNLGAVCSELGDHENAINHFKLALGISTKIYGPTHPTVATAKNNLGSIYQDLGYIDKAIDFYQQALTIYETLYDPTHPTIAGQLNNLGTAKYELGDREKALHFFERALDISRKIYGDRHVQVATARSNLGALYVESGKYEQARENLEKAYTIFNDILGSAHPHTVATKDCLDNCP